MSVNLQAIGASGIFAAEAEISAVESNISNASNPNYSVESVNLQANAGYGGIGNGVTDLGTVRASAPYLNSEINTSQSGNSYSQAYSLATTQAQQALAPSSGNDLSGTLQNLFNAFTNLSASPQNATVRASALAAIAQFAQTDQGLSSSLGSIASNQLTQVSSLVSQVNNATKQVAQLNGQITSDQAGGQSAAALEDQRDALVNQLATLIGANGDAQGNVTVGGVPLVTGTSALNLSAVGSGASLGLQVNLANGSLPVNVSQIGGTLGGVLAGSASVLQLQAQVNQLSTSVASALNTQAASGYGLDGSSGTALFTVPGGGGPIAVNSALTEQNLGASATAAGVPGDGSNAAALAAIGNNPNLVAALPNSTPVQAFSEITSAFGTVVQNANNDQQESSATLQSLTQLKGSITGVSLNDQLTQLIQYQNSLEASGRAVQAANDIATFLIQNLS
jgi:flagellar hook-associated protein 1 FlgK